MPKYALSPALREQKGQNHEAAAQNEESAHDTASAEETPEALHHLTLVPLAALAYAASPPSLSTFPGRRIFATLAKPTTHASANLSAFIPRKSGREG